MTYNKTAPLCDTLAVFRPNKSKGMNPTECVVNTNNYSVYTNSMIVCAVTIFAYILAGGVITKLGRKNLFIILSVISSLSAMSLFFSRNILMTLSFASIFIATGSVMINNMLAIIVEMFPTTLRTMTVALAMMSGRSGAVIGNSLYPLLLETGCAPPFFYNGFLALSCALLGLLLPSAELTSLT